MNRDEIMQLARNVGAAWGPDDQWCVFSNDELERFAAVIAATNGGEMTDHSELLADLRLRHEHRAADLIERLLIQRDQAMSIMIREREQAERILSSAEYALRETQLWPTLSEDTRREILAWIDKRARA